MIQDMRFLHDTLNKNGGKKEFTDQMTGLTNLLNSNAGMTLGLLQSTSNAGLHLSSIAKMHSKKKNNNVVSASNLNGASNGQSNNNQQQFADNSLTSSMHFLHSLNQFSKQMANNKLRDISSRSGEGDQNSSMSPAATGGVEHLKE